MRTILTLCAFLLAFQTSIISQTDSSYYPMQTGNFWEYWGMQYGAQLKMYVTIKGDTLMNNGKRYFAFFIKEVESILPGSYEYLRPENGSLVYKYVYDDSCTEHEDIIYNFSVKDSSYWPMCGRGFGNSLAQKYHYGIYSTSSGYYLGFNSPIESKLFTNVVITNENGLEEIVWNPIKGIGSVFVAKGIGVVQSFAELSPLWLLKGAIINGKKYGTITTGIEDNNSVKTTPVEFSVNGFPNPFNSSCKISVNIPEDGHFNLCVYDILGRNIRSLHYGEIRKGSYTFNFTAADLPGGIYIITAKTGSRSVSNKVLLLK